MPSERIHPRPDSTPAEGVHNKQNDETAESATSTDNKEPPDISNLINKRMHDYPRLKLSDYDLWETFKEDFGQYGGKLEQLFKSVDHANLRSFRNLLIQRGIWITTDRNCSVVDSLIQIISQKEPRQWTYTEAFQHVNQKGPFDSPVIRALENHEIQMTGEQASTEDDDPAYPPPQTSRYTAPPEPLQHNKRLSIPLEQLQYQRRSEPMVQPYEHHRRSEPLHQPYEQQVDFGKHVSNRETEYKQKLPLARTYGKDIANSAKLFTNDTKYDGTNGNLLYKLTIFKSICSRCDIPSEAYLKALPNMLQGLALNQFFTANLESRTFEHAVLHLQNFFEGVGSQRKTLAEWNQLTLQSIMQEKPDKSTTECLQILINKLSTIQQGLQKDLQGTSFLLNKLVTACEGIPACQIALADPPQDLGTMLNKLQSSIIAYEKVSPPTSTYYTDRRYYPPRGDSKRNFGNNKWSTKRKNYGGDLRKDPKSNLCFTCGKPGCRSYNHSPAERQRARDEFKNTHQNTFRSYRTDNPQKNTRFEERLDQYINDVEGDENSEDELEEAFMNLSTNQHDDDDDEVEEEMVKGQTEHVQTMFTTAGEATNPKVLTDVLVQQALVHTIKTDASVHTVGDRYGSDKFIGVMIDTGASKASTAGKEQLQALQKLHQIDLNTSTAGSINVQFGIGNTSSIGSVDLELPIGTVRFHVVKASTPFLLCLEDMDKRKAYFNNITNRLVSPNGESPVVRRFGHPFILPTNIQSVTNYITESLLCNPCYLTEIELRRLHRRFGHPAVDRLHKILTRSGHEDVDMATIEHLTKFCHHCQVHSKSPGRFKFTLRDEDNSMFNYSLIIDIMYIDGAPVLHVVDEATRMNAGRWLDNVSSKHTWDALRACWIDVYLGPPDLITTDAGKNFVSKEFKLYANELGIQIKTVPVEAHNSIGMVERYHAPVKRAYQIIHKELPDLPRDMALQMALKAINDSAGPNGLVPTLLVFGAYPRMVESDPPHPTTDQRAKAVKKAMIEITKLRAQRQVADALNMRNGPSTTAIHDLPMNSDVLLWREAGTEWSGPYKLVSTDGEVCTLQLPSGHTQFKATSCKPYNVQPVHEPDEPPDELPDELPSGLDEQQELIHEPTREPRGPLVGSEQPSAQTPLLQPPLLQPPLSQSQLIQQLMKKYPPVQQPPAQKQPLFHRKPQDEPLFQYQVKRPVVEKSTFKLKENVPKVAQNTAEITVFLNEDFDPNLANYEPDTVNQYTGSRLKEINGLVEKGVFELATIIPEGERIFNSRFVDEIKHPGTPNAYEKSRLVVQAYNDKGKGLVLTQSPTIQRVSQRIILCLAAIRRDTTKLYLRDISQAYVQSTTTLNRNLFIRAPQELAQAFDVGKGTIFRVIRPLYGVPEAGNHWFKTYHNHHMKKLHMNQSTFDPCLLHTNGGPEVNNITFGVVGLQTDDTLFVADESFADMEQRAIEEAKFPTKQREQLTEEHGIKFNGAMVEMDKDGNILLSQPRQCMNLRLVDPKERVSTVSSRGEVRHELTPKEQYIAQRARGAYIASMCQPEASFDLSFSAQVVQPTEKDIEFINKRLQWQIDNAQRGLKFVKLDEASLRLIVFTDASFANNKDLSSQMGFVIVLADQWNKANILHWSSVKCKRVTRAVLASELYALVHGFDIGGAIKSTLELQLRRHIPLILCTDSKSIFECLVKLGTTREKRLMIDIMCLRQAYERREITEVKWIKGKTNPADALTKSSPSPALTALIDTNTIELEELDWVERD